MFCIKVMHITETESAICIAKTESPTCITETETATCTTKTETATCQGIIQTKMEVSIQFWMPNLGIGPKYD